jgi:PncC family amidohydrolase
MNETTDICEIEAARLLRTLVRRSLSVACAESCTGGIIASAITSIPGASMAFKGGVIAYSNDAKIALLNVHEKTIEKHGAVSPETVIEMAEGVKKILHADVSVAVSGIAGPEGGTPEKPVGTVWFGFVGRTPNAERQVFPGDRHAIQKAAAAYAIRSLNEAIESLDRS